nr:MAG TPA: hypothetical protein [Caudoviricetes sp.]
MTCKTRLSTKPVQIAQKVYCFVRSGIDLQKYFCKSESFLRFSIAKMILLCYN